AAAFGMRRGDVMGVAGAPATEQFGVNNGAPLASVFQLLEHDQSGALAKDEAIALFVERPTRPLWVVVAFGEGLGRNESTQAHSGESRLRAARDHDVGLAALHRVKRVGDRIGRGSAGRGDGGVWTRQAVV